MSAHKLVVFNAIDVPEKVQEKVLELLGAYAPDIYERDCDENGVAL